MRILDTELRARGWSQWPAKIVGDGQDSAADIRREMR